MLTFGRYQNIIRGKWASVLLGYITRAGIGRVNLVLKRYSNIFILNANEANLHNIKVLMNGIKRSIVLINVYRGAV